MGDAPGDSEGPGLLRLGGQYVCVNVFSKLSKMDRLEAVEELIRDLDVDESIAFVNLMDGRLTNSANKSNFFQEDTEDGNKLREMIDYKGSKAEFREITENEGEGQHSNKLASRVPKSCSDINYNEDLRDDGKYVCRWEGCGKILESKKQYRWHDYAYHKAGNEKRKVVTKASCETCGALVSFYQLSRHIRNVHGKKFTCEYCRKSFSQESLLTSHIALHSEETFFSCSQCGKKIKHLKTVKQCEKGHGVKYTCHLCTYTTQRKDNFDSHVNTHLNRKPYKCLVCEFKTSNKLSLTHHVETRHALGKFKHSCHLCDFKTQRKDHLDHHVNVHLSIRPFLCLICEFKTFEKRDLKKHLQKRHVTVETSLNQLEQTYPLLYTPSRSLDSWRNDGEGAI